ncbi:SRPBCC domain-containing protein [Actinomadura sp. ATCC 31491]|uniref:SRPBCC domain-containing protein n=1 Tax=Actinomadura luzonensis TaxID=2805427 RepID=A0ABT0FT44_9ACTN|nr:SRPBCC domain-containing protein [Actinomadura luzonensis]MCK2215514.1 SRPBCC domain-containing protein [Actinomadura luzonensis]
MNENLTRHPDGRTTLRMQRRLPHPPEKVWRAITQPQHLTAWFPADVTLDGDRITYGFGPDGRITHNDPPRLYAHTWGEDHLRWELQPDDNGGTLLTLTHTFTDHHGAASFTAGWHTCLIALLHHLDQRPHNPPPSMARLHEDYIHILGLDPATRDGDTLRLERQLTRPADHVWHHLDGDHATVGQPPPAPFTVPGVPAGPVTRAETGKLLEYDTPGGGVRWELAEGTGHGARLIVTHTGDPSALPAWRSRVVALAVELLNGGK